MALQRLSKPIYVSKNIKIFQVAAVQPGLRIATPKKNFKLAVTRNKIKRQIKSIFHLNNLNEDYKKNDLVLEVVNFLEKDKKRPICTPFSK